MQKYTTNKQYKPRPDPLNSDHRDKCQSKWATSTIIMTTYCFCLFGSGWSLHTGVHISVIKLSSRCLLSRSQMSSRRRSLLGRPHVDLCTSYVSTQHCCWFNVQHYRYVLRCYCITGLYTTSTTAPTDRLLSSLTVTFNSVLAVTAHTNYFNPIAIGPHRAKTCMQA